MNAHPLGTVAELWRYPVKSMLGERCESLRFDARGVEGDRRFAIRDAAGKFGSGKNTRRFRRIDGLLDFTARYSGDVPELCFPSGEILRGDSATIDEALSLTLGQPVTLAEEAGVSHLDAGPVQLLTSASLQWLQSALPGETIGVARFRPNLVIEVAGTGRVEEAWVGRRLRLGSEVLLQVTDRTERCGMVILAQGELPDEPAVLRHIGQFADLRFGVYAEVIMPGVVRSTDSVILEA